MRCVKAADKLTDDLLPGVLPESLQKLFVTGEFPLLDADDEDRSYDATTPDNRFPLVLEVPACKLCG